MISIDKKRKFICDFVSISVSQICKKYNISKSSISQAKASKEKSDIVFTELNEQISKLYNDLWSTKDARIL